MGYDTYTIDVESFLRTDELGESISLPYSDELDRAVLLINKLCSDEVRRRSKLIRDEYLSRKYREIKTSISDPSKMKEILNEIIDKEL